MNGPCTPPADPDNDSPSRRWVKTPAAGGGFRTQAILPPQIRPSAPRHGAPNAKNPRGITPGAFVKPAQVH